jgi:hypothetical protein
VLEISSVVQALVLRVTGSVRSQKRPSQYSTSMVSSEDSLLRKALIDRIKLFTGKDFFLDSIYETEELEDFHDKILDYETIMHDIENNTQEISPDHKNLWIVSQLPEFSRRRPVPWNRATLEQITELFELHEDLKEL